MLRSRSATARRFAGICSAGLVAVLVVAALSIPTAQASLSPGWNIITSANSGAQVSDLLLGTTCTNAWNCWAVGASIPNINNNGQPVLLIQHWDGSSWVEEPAAAPTGTQASILWNVTCVSSTDCWSVGAQKQPDDAGPSPLAEHWDGTSWSAVPTPDMPGYLFSISCAGGSDCWAAGTTVTDDGNSAPLNGFIDHWDGASWSQVPTAPSGQTFDQFNSVSCADASDCWAVGFAGPNQQQTNFLPNVLPNEVGDQAFAEHWNGVAWSIAALPAPTTPFGADLTSVTCVTSSECTAVGATMDANGDPSTTLIDGWDGSTWSAVPSPNPDVPNDLLTDVTCLGASACWATGVTGVQLNNGQPGPFIEKWDGSSWSVDPSPNVTAFGYLAGIACAAGNDCFATGFAATNTNNNFTLQTLVEQELLPTAVNQGLWMVGADGGVFSFGTAGFAGSMGGTRLNAPIVGMAPTPDGGGYWLVARDGGIFTFGDAQFYGSTGGMALNDPIVGMASTPDGKGYWLVAADGGVFSFGDATFDGSMGGTRLNAPIVGMAAAPDGGYWLAANDGGIFTFGGAGFDGSMGGAHLAVPIVGMSPTPDGGGYWLVAGDGGIFAFGDAGFYGSVPGQGIHTQVAIDGITPTPDGRGYWIVGRDGAVYTYGDAQFMGSLVGTGLAAPVSGIASPG
jgi:hypothetical protein